MESMVIYGLAMGVQANVLKKTNLYTVTDKLLNDGISSTEENLTNAESRIRDVDMAQEMVEFTKSSILNQAAISMLAQANVLPMEVLNLLNSNNA